MFFRQVLDSSLAQYAYVIGCQRTREAIVIDPERDIDRYVSIAEAEGLRITATAETHIHADFLSGARELAERFGIRVYLSDEGGAEWAYEWVRSGRYDHRLLKDGDVFRVGNIELEALHTPGHTPEHLSYLVVDRGSAADAPMGVVSGDFVFVGDLGRPDLLESAAGQAGAQEPAARRLYQSVVHGLLTWPEFLQVWPGHGAGSACGKALGAVPISTVGYERRFNPAVAVAAQGEASFVESILRDQPEPPLYFGRMKRVNKQGPPLLGELPRPPFLEAADLERLSTSPDAVVIDTSPGRQAFTDAHLPGALYAPLDKSFPTIVGSYVEPQEPIYLVIEPAELESAVRQLVRIGLDRVVGAVAPSVVGRYAGGGGRMARTERILFAELAARAGRHGVRVLDVRGAAEHAAGHVPDALNVAHTRLRARLDAIPAGSTLLVHCQTGARAAAAVSFLERAGHTAILVDDDFANWRAATADTT